MTLESWLAKASRGLSADSVLKVRAEISDHYQSSYEAAVASGISAEEAERQAVGALGNPRATNRLYRRVFLTAFEARVIRVLFRLRRAIASDDLAILVVVTAQLIWLPILIWKKWTFPALPLLVPVFAWVGLVRWNTTRTLDAIRWCLVVVNATVFMPSTVPWLPIATLPFLAYLEYRLLLLRRKVRNQQLSQLLHQ